MVALAHTVVNIQSAERWVSQVPGGKYAHCRNEKNDTTSKFFLTVARNSLNEGLNKGTYQWNGGPSQAGGGELKVRNSTVWHSIDRVDSKFARVMLTILYIVGPVLFFGVGILVLPLADWIAGQFRNQEVVITRNGPLQNGPMVAYPQFGGAPMDGGPAPAALPAMPQYFGQPQAAAAPYIPTKVPGALYG